MKVFWRGVDEKTTVADFIENATRVEYVPTITYHGDALTDGPFADFWFCLVINEVLPEPEHFIRTAFERLKTPLQTTKRLSFGAKAINCRWRSPRSLERQRNPPFLTPF